jgi:hypothetical protein
VSKCFFDTTTKRVVSGFNSLTSFTWSPSALHLRSGLLNAIKFSASVFLGRLVEPPIPIFYICNACPMETFFFSPLMTACEKNLNILFCFALLLGLHTIITMSNAVIRYTIPAAPSVVYDTLKTSSNSFFKAHFVCKLVIMTLFLRYKF